MLRVDDVFRRALDNARVEEFEDVFGGWGWMASGVDGPQKGILNAWRSACTPADLVPSVSLTFKTVLIANTRLGDINVSRISKRVARYAAQWPIASPHPLTYESSVDCACEQAGLEKYGHTDRPGRKAWRYVYASPTFITWMHSTMPALRSDDPEGSEPKVQLESEFEGFCDGRGLSFGSDIRHLQPLALGVWELKTPDLRLFGWFPVKNYFIVHIGAMKRDLQKIETYTPYIDMVVRYRAQQKARLAEYVAGGQQDVISNRVGSL